MKKLVLAVQIFILVVAPLNVLGAFDVHNAMLTAELAYRDGTPLPNTNMREDASVSFSIGQEAIIYMTFDEPVRFTGSRVAIDTDILVSGRAAARTSHMKILSFIVDGRDLGGRDQWHFHSDEPDYMKFAVTCRWAECDYDTYDVTALRPFTTLEITFVVPDMPVEEDGYVFDEDMGMGADWEVGGVGEVGEVFGEVGETGETSESGETSETSEAVGETAQETTRGTPTASTPTGGYNNAEGEDRFSAWLTGIAMILLAAGIVGAVAYFTRRK
ncbi:MAG: hypothetical protein FWG87_01915 [Defluviitaleaceae bacterium]|nr:hypothetical protein [Defluviitaleaceae bacterium]